MVKALVPLANGVEEMEAVIIIDVLRRAGWSVTTAGLQAGPVTASRQVRLVPDGTWDEVNPAEYDWIVIPGGAPGTRELIADDRVIAALQAHARAGRWLGAVCAGPTVLHTAGLLDGKRVTSHPAVADRLDTADRCDDPVVIDGQLVTSQGPGTSFDFALTIVALEAGPCAAKELADAMRHRTDDAVPLWQRLP